MYIGNSRILLGKTTNETVIGDWFAVAPSNASGGTYGIQSGFGYCSEIFNGYLYVGGAIASMINGSTTTNNVNQLIKYNLNDSNANWESAVSTNNGDTFSIRNIGNGDHLLVATSQKLFYITSPDSLTANVSSNEAYQSISNTFTSIKINATDYPSVGSNLRAVVNSAFTENNYGIYKGDDKTLSFVNLNQLVNIVDSYVSSNTGGKILSLATTKSLISDSNGFTAIGDATTYITNDTAHQCMLSTPVNNNIIYVVGRESQLNHLSEFNISSETYNPLAVNVDQPTALNTVVYNNINYLIIGGSGGNDFVPIAFMNLNDPKVTKPFPEFSSTTDPIIRSISVDADSTIYVTGSFQFTDKNGVTARNIAKFVPGSAKISP